MTRIFHVLFDTFVVISVILLWYGIAFLMSIGNATHRYYEQYREQEEFGKYLDEKQIKSHEALLKLLNDEENKRP